MAYMGLLQINNLVINEMTNGSYLDRTRYNATKSDVTCACAIDFTTQGERATERYAEGKYLAISLSLESIVAARKLYRFMVDMKASELNLAGNGMHVLHGRKISQRRVNLWVHDMLSMVHAHYPIKKLISGGQTGVDIAAAVVGPVLFIPTEINFPKGYRQRDCNGAEISSTLDEVMQSIQKMQTELFDDIKGVNHEG